MKTKKIVIGAMAAAMLSLTSIAPATAADETVQISVSETDAVAGGTFTVEVSFKDVPSTAIQATQFALEFDKSVLQITDIKAGAITETGATSADDSASQIPTFNKYISNNGGWASVMWSTKVKDSANWISKDGVFCTITGTVADDAADGKYDIKVVPTDRETFDGSGVANADIDMGYKASDSGYVQYTVKTVDGGVNIGATGKYLKGDADESGAVSVSDIVCVLQYAANKVKYPLKSDQAYKNADVNSDGDVNAVDAAEIQYYDATGTWH